MKKVILLGLVLLGGLVGCGRQSMDEPTNKTDGSLKGGGHGQAEGHGAGATGTNTDITNSP